MRMGRKEKIALIPLILCVLIWIVPDSTTPHVSSSSRMELPEEITETSPAISEARWQPGIELPLLGVMASIAIFCLMRIQDRLQDRARQVW